MTVWTQDRRELALLSLERWRGTPHRNRLAEPGVGIDCIKLVYRVCHEAGVFPSSDFNGYDTSSGMWKQSSKLQDTILQCVHGSFVDRGPWEFGDIAIFKTGNRSAHCGFIAGRSLWHALANRCVTESDLALWEGEFAGAVRLSAAGFKASPDRVPI